MSPRRAAIRRRTALIAAVLAAGVALAAIAVGVTTRATDEPVTVAAQFEDAVGLYAGNGVSVLGMRVGKVTRIEPRGGYVEVTLAIDRGVDIPADATAVTVSNSILTDRHVELTPPYRGGPKLRNGDVLGPGRTRTPVEFDRTLSMINKLGKALHGDDRGQGPLGDLVNLGAAVTGANGPDIKATLSRLSEALRVGSDGGAASAKSLQAIITGVAELTRAAAENDTAIREFGSSVRQLSDILDDEQLGTGSTGSRLNAVLAATARLLENHREQLSATFADTRAITTTLAESSRELAETLDVGPLTIDNIYNTIDADAGSLRAHMAVDKVVLNSQYGKELCNLLGLKQLGCATGTLKDYGPDFGLTQVLDLMANGISGTP